METPNYYGIIPAPVRYCEGLEANAKLLYCEITALSNKHGYCFASNQYFADLFHVHPGSISRLISSLSEHGFLRLEISKMAGNQRHIYPLGDMPQKKKKEGGINNIVNRGYSQKREGGINKIVNPYSQNCEDPIHKNVNRNTISNNTFNIKVDDVETTPPTPPKTKKIETEKQTPTPPLPTPTQPAQPPALPWRSSPEFQGGVDKFGQALRGRGDFPKNLDTDYYFDRAGSWSDKKETAPVSRDWIGDIAGWVRRDKSTGKMALIVAEQPAASFSGNNHHRRNSNNAATVTDNRPEADKYKKVYTHF